MSGPRLGVLAGRGPLPAQVIDAARGAGREVLVVGFEGETDPALVDGHPHLWARLGEVGKVLKALHGFGAEEVVMIGPVRRPNLKALKLDWRGVQLLTRLGLRGQGDNQLFKVIVEALEHEGFRVVGADDLVGTLLVPDGTLTAAAPDEAAWRDIDLGIRVASRLGELDVGQAVVVQNGLVLGVEAVEGTDRLLERCATLRREGGGGVLVKVKKPKQERRADLPTIGPGTVRGAAAAGLDGIAAQAGHCLLIDRQATVAEAAQAGLFIVGVAGEPT